MKKYIFLLIMLFHLTSFSQDVVYFDKEGFLRENRTLYSIYKQINPKMQLIFANMENFDMLNYSTQNASIFLKNINAISKKDLEDGYLLNLWGKKIDLQSYNFNSQSYYVIKYSGVHKDYCEDEISLIPEDFSISINSKKNIKLKQDISKNEINYYCHLLNNDIYLYVLKN